jgi:probable HAF family extracellular repeat protein
MLMKTGTLFGLVLRALLLVLLTLVVVRPLAAQVHSITDLGTLGGETSEASAINGSGQVVGSSMTASGATHGFLYSDGVMTSLGTLRGGTSSHATGINDLGQVVGSSGVNEYGPQFREFQQGFIWQNGTMRALGSLFCPCNFNQRYGTSAAYAINASGQVVGDSGTPRGGVFRHAFVWHSRIMQDLEVEPGSIATSRAYGINASGQVVGVLARRAVGVLAGRATLWHGGVARDLGTLPGDASSTARAINAAGHVVGESLAGPLKSRAVLWHNGTTQDLGSLPGDTSSQANGINAFGQVVGWSRATAKSVSRAVRWQGNVATDLNSLLPQNSGWVLTSASAINDEGQIVGVGLHDGRWRAFLLDR